MRYQAHLIETLSDIVYHSCYIKDIYDILNENKFELTAQFGTPEDKRFHNKLFYFSTSSTKWGGYNYKFPDYNMVNIVLDGKKFSQRYKGMPVDYWGSEYRASALEFGNSDERLYNYNRNDEHEQRIYSNNPEIPNAVSYIKEVHILFGNNKTEVGSSDFLANLMNHDKYHEIKRVSELCKLHDIPYYLYDNKNDFIPLNKKKGYQNTDYFGGYKQRFIKAILRIIDKKPLNDEELSYARDFVSVLEEYEYCILNNYDLTGPRVRDFLSQLRNEIHNLRKDPEGKPLVNKLMAVYHKNKEYQIEGIFPILMKVAREQGIKNIKDLPYSEPYYTKGTKWN